jgi:hypothetical protein
MTLVLDTVVTELDIYTGFERPHGILYLPLSTSGTTAN